MPSVQKEQMVPTPNCQLIVATFAKAASATLYSKTEMSNWAQKEEGRH